jgi:hypothetical protein
MTLTVAPNFDALIVKLGDFIASVLPTVPSPPPVIQMPDNRAAMPPPVPGFVGMTPSVQSRIATNFESWDANDPNVDSVQLEQSVRVAVQCDFYGAASADWAAMFSTVMRSEYGCRQLAPIAAPLYNDDPRMAPLVTGEEEYEQRWIVTAYVQYNPVTSTPEQFATVLDATLINVDVSYPP